MRLMLERYAYLPTYTQGRLYVGDVLFQTIERPWIANPGRPGGMVGISCVPDGAYRLIPHVSAKHPGDRHVYALVNESLGVYYQARPAGQTWGRTAILIHPGNRPTDVEGCIAVGTTAMPGVVERSHAAMDELRRLLGRGMHQLYIYPAGTEEIPA